MGVNRDEAAILHERINASESRLSREISEGVKSVQSTVSHGFERINGRIARNEQAIAGVQSIATSADAAAKSAHHRLNSLGEAVQSAPDRPPLSLPAPGSNAVTKRDVVVFGLGVGALGVILEWIKPIVQTVIQAATN